MSGSPLFPPPPGNGFGPPGMAPPPPPPGWQAHKPTSSRAVMSLVFGLGGLVGGFICGLGYIVIPVGLVMGIIGIAETGAAGKFAGRGLAIAGTIVSSLALVGGALLIAFTVQQFTGAMSETSAEMEARLDRDIELIVERLQQYSTSNGGSLGPGGPILNSIQAQASNAPAERVTERLELEHLVSPVELQTPSIDRFVLTVTGKSSAVLVVTDWGGETQREVEITDATQARWRLVFP